MHVPRQKRTSPASWAAVEHAASWQAANMPFLPVTRKATPSSAMARSVTIPTMWLSAVRTAESVCIARTTARQTAGFHMICWSSAFCKAILADRFRHEGPPRLVRRYAPKYETLAGAAEPQGECTFNFDSGLVRQVCAGTAPPKSRLCIWLLKKCCRMAEERHPPTNLARPSQDLARFCLLFHNPLLSPV
ncbi:hypothetical protein BAUCODRAFT_331495 [Baudoinia panamericana UAMH 10762]|uniref:Uncharacterized protein n=1 Tax=Baudoinia panamericana (strain UAMH 10762) TaxID=717646 RepID=M2MI28_BAUPA|nr:uncharacterized protein BAUCODRAFT_331495 [Baudoinia panamericana UAMH 10762]EMC90918.1 hypothetical protein BAUCODRAFT_331495 [Baudoinia panamericana UAMH 10762]